MSNFSKVFFKNYKKYYFLLIISIIICCFTFSIKDLTLFQRIEANTLDFRFNKYPLSELADTSIVLISIDNKSLEFAQQNQVFWPWPREFYAVATKYLADEGVKSIYYDIQFYEPDYDRATLDSNSSDESFAEAIGYHGGVILGVQYGEDKVTIPEDVKNFAIKVKINNKKRSYPHQLKGAQYPIEKLLKQTNSIGGINIQPDDDGVIRHVPLFYQIDSLYYPSMSFAGYLKSFKNTPEIVLEPYQLRIEKQYIPLNHSYNFPINWYGKGGTEGVFKYIPFSAVIQSASAKLYGGESTIKAGYFKGKSVIIGTTANGLMDLKTSPYSKVMPGMEIWATILSNLKNNHFIKFQPDLYLYFMNILLCFIIMFCFTRLNPIQGNVLILIMISLLMYAITYIWKYRYYINMTIPLLSLIFSYFIIVLISYFMEGRSKREIRRIFTRYLHPDVIEFLMKNPDQIDMGGEEIEATIIFSDIYNFTTYSEGKKPKELVNDLNEYFNSITNSILEHNGLLDKYTGDGLMAVFGAPIARKDHAELACLAALKHKKFSLEIAKMNNKPSTVFHLNTRLGINSGMIVAGNIGSEKRMDYTAIGDPVNLSARLEGVNKIFKTQIIISESTWVFVKDKFICRELDFLRVKGKTEPTRIYELIDEYSEENIKLYPWIEKYKQALDIYRQGDFVLAKEKFQELYNSSYKDNPSQTMMERCEYLILNPPKDWDGILTLNVK